MQERRKLLPILLVILVVLLAAVVLVACGGSGAVDSRGQSWMNLPSLPVNVDASGNANIYGIGLGQVLTPDQVQLMQTMGDAQRLEARVGFEGVAVLKNGEDALNVLWNDESQANLQGVLRQVPAAAPAADYLPMLRNVGVGVALNLPPAQGAPALNVPKWTGPTPFQPSAPANATPPIDIGFLSFDQSGQALIAGIPASTLGIPLALDAGTMGMLQQFGIGDVTVDTQPDGLHLALNGNPLPVIAYNDSSLTTLQSMLTPLLPAGPTAELVNGLLPRLPSLDLNLNVGFNGAPADITLPDINLKLTEGGGVNVFGLDIPTVSIPMDSLQPLIDAGIGSLNVRASDQSIDLAVNGQQLPTINFTPAGRTAIAGIVSSQAGVSPDLINGGLDILAKGGVAASIELPGGGSAAPAVTIPAAPDVAPPVIRANIVVDNGEIVSFGGIPAATLGALGVTLPTLPPEVMSILGSLGADTINLTVQPDGLTILAGGEEVLSVAYDATSLGALWGLAKPLAGATLADNPGLTQLIEQMILPMMTISDVNVTIELQ